ncbi:MAG: hypothetical protein JWO85_685 [Candidatus Eremiobacteraeota bacterium]|nr:hypothetical protein [Candidatus Eremiobacteraeota bacterium]
MTTVAKRPPSAFVDANGEWRVPEKSELDPNVSSNFVVALIRTFPLSTAACAICSVLLAALAVDMVSYWLQYHKPGCRFRRCR